ncbi:helix-turn-helix domain-containing protein [uncultured Roseobacter sp.]|uniref:IclR family transcriptional regulator n=1 Tax=uncultured Roseobacter sp. TaxID=114847 RepID=UPI002624C1B7|nr:helix-turn-helix domain-containing protein [uncultured Roseobacter sp.]
MKEHGTDRKFANTLARGLTVLQAFNTSHDPLYHADIAQRTGLPKPTVSRLTYTLCKLGYLSQPERNGPFFPGPAAVALGAAASLSMPFVQSVAGAMQFLADETETMTAIAVCDGAEMVLTHIWQPSPGPVLSLRPGHRIPVMGTSSGLAFLSALNQDCFEAMAPTPGMRGFRENGHLQLLRRGFTIAPREHRRSGPVRAVGVPFFAQAFGAPVVFASGGLSGVVQDRLEKEIGPALCDIVQALERRLGQRAALIAGRK